MSTWELTDLPATRPAAAPAQRPRLRGLTGGRSTPIRTVPFAGVVAALLVAGMVGLLALNVHLETQAFALSKAQRQAATLTLEVSDKQAQVYAKSGPEQLAAAASALGMVPNTYPAFVDLRTGRIVGTPKAVTGDEMPGLRLPGAPVPVPDATTPVQSNVQSWFPLDTSAPIAPAGASAAASPAASPQASAKQATAAPTKATTSAKAAATAKPTTKATTTKPVQP
nr:hypothetical protein [Propionibacterium sp.]